MECLPDSVQNPAVQCEFKVPTWVVCRHAAPTCSNTRRKTLPRSPRPPTSAPKMQSVAIMARENWRSCSLSAYASRTWTSM